MAKLTEPISSQTPVAEGDTPETVVTPTVEGQINGTAPVDPAASTTTEKKLSPKNKITRGIPADWKTTWVDANFSPEDHLRLTKIASQRDTTVLKLLQMVLTYGMDAYKSQFDADVVEFDKAPKKIKTPAKSGKKIEDMTEAELEKAAQSAQQRAETAAANAATMLAAAKARRLAAQAAAATPAE